MITPRELFDFNVGFILHQPAGYERIFPVEAGKIKLTPELVLTDLEGSIKATKTGDGVLVEVELSANSEIECVRCLQVFTQKRKTEYNDNYVLPQKKVELGDLVIPEDNQLDLTSGVIEEMLIAIPIKAVCSEDCVGLCPECGNLKNACLCDETNEEIDPRLAVLKNFLKDDS